MQRRSRQPRKPSSELALTLDLSPQPTRPALEFPAHSFAATDAGRVGANVASEPTVATLADQLLMDHFAPAAVVARSSGHIVRSTTSWSATSPCQSRGDARCARLARDVLQLVEQLEGSNED